jgi:NitT/TauT family transport system substrate-binding protein
MKLPSILLFPLIAGVITAVTTHAASPEKPNLTLAVGGKATLYYLPLTLAERLGYFKDEGLEVEVLDFPGGAKALQALIGGSADIVSGGFEHTLQMQAKGQKVQAFVLEGNAALALGLVKGRFATYAGPQDLKGRRIGVTAPGSSTNTFLNQLLASAKLKPEDVSVIGVGTGATAVAAARGGQLDAIANVEPAIVMLEKSGDLKVVHETFTEAGTRAVYGGPVPSACLYAKQSFIQANPNTVQALTNAMVRALRWLRKATAEDVMKAIPPEYTLGDRAVYAAALERLRTVYSPDGAFTADGVERSLKVTAAGDASVRDAGAGIRLDQTWTNAFVEKVR